MPEYQWVCPECDLTVDMRVAMKDSSWRLNCWHCGHSMERRYSIPAVRLTSPSNASILKDPIAAGAPKGTFINH